MEIVKILGHLLTQSYYSGVDCLCFPFLTLTAQQLFAHWEVRLGSCKINLCNFCYNARKIYRLVCHLWNWLSWIQKLAKLYLFSVCQMLKSFYKTPLNLWKTLKNFEDTTAVENNLAWNVSYESSETIQKCLVTYRILSNFDARSTRAISN